LFDMQLPVIWGKMPLLLNWHLAASLKPAVPPGDVSLSRLVSEIANAPAIREALQFFARDKQRITEQQLQLCRVSGSYLFRTEACRVDAGPVQSAGRSGAH
jgi:hypothetical protein